MQSLAFVLRISLHYIERWNIKKRESLDEAFSFCAPLGTRTLDPLIKSQLLYQLS